MKHQNYFSKKDEKAAAAKRHVDEMARIFPERISLSVKNATIYDEEPLTRGFSDNRIPCIVEEIDSVSAVMEYAEMGSKACVLNFASYKQAGGMYLSGSIAQEECLCAESTLYNVLSQFEADYYEPNRSELNRALYKNRALYTPEIAFARDYDNIVFCDVLTCAAPNFKAAHTYQKVTREENYEVLKSRIYYVLNIMENEGVKVPILGAFGCGVFDQDAHEVASIFKALLDEYDYSFEKVVFAVIPGPNADAFKEVFA